MTPLRAKMIRDMQLQRLAPKPHRPMGPLSLAEPSSTAVRPTNSARTRSARTSTMYSANAAWRGVPGTRWPVGARSSLSQPSAGMHSTPTCPHARHGGSCRT